KLTQKNFINKNHIKTYDIMRFLFLFIFLFFFQLGISQTIISGKLVDDQHKPISNVSVSYNKISTLTILGFNRSNNNGEYRLVVNEKNLDSIEIVFQHMNYEKKKVVIA